jgi:hypothetical protein
VGRVLPNFFIVGAAKSGTTSMYQYLEVAAGYRRRHNPLSAPRGALARRLLAGGRAVNLGKRLLPGEWRWFLRDKVLSRRVERPEIEARAAWFLSRIYEPEVRRLERLLGRERPWGVGA